MDDKARRAAKRAGYNAKKDRKTGGFAIIDPDTRAVVFGWDRDLTPDEVIEWCNEPSSLVDQVTG